MKRFFGVLGGVGAGEQRQPGQLPKQHQVDKPDGHSEIMRASSGW
jgi:hypothetical protein